MLVLYTTYIKILCIKVTCNITCNINSRYLIECNIVTDLTLKISFELSESLFLDYDFCYFEIFMSRHNLSLSWIMSMAILLIKGCLILPLIVTKNSSNFATAWPVLIHGSSCFILYLAEDKQRSCARYIKRRPKLDPVRWLTKYNDELLGRNDFAL